MVKQIEPFIITVTVDFHEPNMKFIEDVIIELRKEYNFEKVEFQKDKIILQNGFPIVFCRIENGNLRVASSASGDNQLGESVTHFLRRVISLFKLSGGILKSLEVVSLLKIEDCCLKSLLLDPQEIQFLNKVKLSETRILFTKGDRDFEFWLRMPTEERAYMALDRQMAYTVEEDENLANTIQEIISESISIMQDYLVLRQSKAATGIEVTLKK